MAVDGHHLLGWGRRWSLPWRHRPWVTAGHRDWWKANGVALSQGRILSYHWICRGSFVVFHFSKQPLTAHWWCFWKFPFHNSQSLENCCNTDYSYINCFETLQQIFLLFKSDMYSDGNLPALLTFKQVNCNELWPTLISCVFIYKHTSCDPAWPSPVLRSGVYLRGKI